jgi:hypothetical protein
MELDFRAAIAALGPDGAFRIANAARPPADYLFNTLLPERPMPTYHVDSGSMTVRSTMAGLVGMDSPYPPTGYAEMSAFLEQTAKIANEVKLTEQTLRHMQDFMMRFRLGGGNTNEAMANELLNFMDKVVLQPHLDRAEWLRGQALVFGEIDWTFNGKPLLVNYGVPAGNFLATRAGADGYGGASSKFWADIRALRRAIRGGIRAIIAHPDTIDMVRYNEANQMVATAESAGSITFRRYVRNAVTGDAVAGQFSSDSGDTVQFILYDREGELLLPAGGTAVVPFMERGKLLAVGNNTADGYRPGMGSITEDVTDSNNLGYTHLAPTVEGQGRPGRWADTFVPENAPWSLHGRAVQNILPVVEAPAKIAVATTEMA